MTTFELDGGVELRPFRVEDAESVLEAVKANYDHLRGFMHWAVPDYSLEHARTFIALSIESAAEKKSLSLGIFSAEKVIGDIALVSIDHVSKKTEIGYWIDKTYEGKGIISASCRRLINYAFGELQMIGSRSDARRKTCGVLRSRSGSDLLTKGRFGRAKCVTGGCMILPFTGYWLPSGTGQNRSSKLAA